MSFKKSETQSDDQKIVFGFCSKCLSKVLNEELIKFGTTCESCFNSYCQELSPYDPLYKKYDGDPKGWAKRIIDRHKSGEKVRPISLKFAEEALRSRYV